ncbi:peptidoglycan DD-metalloendopeptidase family protein [Candidatus Woesebacteria bacterium]|nr:MAG: peptidoglycan DD-metalloendopeptidase family protein [Candidatus Woesebacteria bacterium]
MKPKRQMFATLWHVWKILWDTPLVYIFFLLLQVSFALLTPTSVEASPFTYIGEYSTNVNDADVEGEYLYVAAVEKIEVFQIHNEDQITKVAEYVEPGCSFKAIDAVGKRAYVTQGDYDCNYSMDIIDFSEFANPHKLLDESLPRGAIGTQEIKVVGNMVYTVGNLSIVDFSDIHDPVVYPKYTPRNGLTFNDLEVLGDLVIITSATGGFYVINISNPAMPFVVTTKDLPPGQLANHHPVGIYKIGNYGYIPIQESALRVYDLSDFGNISQVSSLTIPSDSRYIEGLDNFVFVASTRYGITAVDVTNPFDPQLVDTYLQDGAKFQKLALGKGLIFGVNTNGGVTALKFEGMETPPDNTPGFMDLPWDYTSDNLSFSQAALAINSYFDHEYPLLSVRHVLEEPLSARSSVLPFFRSSIDLNINYSSHDGYDWGRKAGAHYGDNILAAAGGIATYTNSCAACGNAVYIDHENGYQSRYYHLMDEGLITSNLQEGVRVIKGQKIGQVGFSGNTMPVGQNGAHIHFMVIKDKNADGQFNDNIPDGIVDPFGWLGDIPDPWTNYTFTLNGVVKTGIASEYLWSHDLTGKKENVPSTGKEVQMEQIKVVFPENSYSTNFRLNMNSSPIVVLSQTTESIGPAVSLVAITQEGDSITHFDSPFKIYFDFSSFDTTDYNLDTLAIYSSNDGTNWDKEVTQINQNEKIAWIEINHLTYFALMGDKNDIDKPQTAIDIVGEKGEGNWYSSNVRVQLDATDNFSGVDYTAYKLNDGDWKEYVGEMEFDSESHYVIEYYSVDKAGNVEESKIIEFNIDKTNPEIRVYFDRITERIKVIPTGGNDQIIRENKKFGKARYRATDIAGNFIEVDVYEMNLLLIHGFSIDTITYDHEETVNINNNYFSTVYDTKKGKIIVFGQSWLLGNNLIKLVYQPLKNKTLVIDTSVSSKIETNDGLSMLSITSNNGSLKVERE